MNGGWRDPSAQGESDSPRRAPSSVAGGLPEAVPQIADHELLSCVGRGSYGEVWLARNVIGGWRAVKVVYRQAFEHERPYEREFEGIRKFEPVSRAHLSQLNILQVGRNDAGGYFYYVMELADDALAPRMDGGAPPVQAGESDGRSAPRELDPATYLPRTLKVDLNRRGRLPLDECLTIGMALATAVEHLHDHGLVHRDIKPSNIIFVKGTPKLADIGLVATMDATLSYVGTSGFLPPEGPGTPQADLYSLGKVLYEMATGRDRQEFPKLPADLAESEDSTRLLELNAVILKACHHDPRQRYQSARELAADLLLLQRGHSVRRLRRIERRLTVLTRVGAVMSAMLLVAAALYWNAARQHRATARQLYVADMNRAQQAWEGGNVALARELLETHRQRQPSMIGFEWRLLARLCQQSDSRLSLRGHTRTVWSVAFSPDGATLATGGGDSVVQLWETASGRLRATLAGHRSFVHAAAFSPDGRRLATGSRDFTVKLWDARGGAELATLTGHTDAVRAVAFSPNGRTLVSGGEDRTLRWWSLDSTQEVASCAAGMSIEQLAFSPGGETLAACGSGNGVHFWDCATHREASSLELHRAMVLSVAYSSNGRLLATASYDGTIRLWDLSEHRELAILGRGAPVRCVAFVPGNQFLAAATEDGLVRFWDVARHEVLTTFRGHTANVRCLAFSPSGRQLATGDEDAVAKLWDVPAEPGLESALKHTGIVNGFAFSPDGTVLATTDSASDTLRLWSMRSQQAIAAAHAATQSVWCVAFAPDGTSLATGGVDFTVRLWNLTNLSEMALLRGHKGGVDSVAFSPDGSRLASGSRDTTAKVWQRATGKELATLPSAGGVMRVVAFAPGGTTLATGCGDGHLLLWDLGSFRRLASLPGHAGEIRALAFSPDGRTLASGGADRTIRLWNLGNRKTTGTLPGHTAMISSLAFSADAKTLASGSWDSTVKLWNLRLLSEVSTLRAHSGQVTQVGFSPDAVTLASSSSDGTVRVWRALPGFGDFQDTGSARRR